MALEDHVEKVCQILLACRKPTLKTTIMQKGKMDSKAWRCYIPRMIDVHLLDVYPVIGRIEGRPTRNRVTYQASAKGQTVLAKYLSVVVMLHSLENTFKSAVSHELR